MFGTKKSDKEKELDQVSKSLDAFGEKITKPEDYVQYCNLIEVEARLLREVMIEKMVAQTEANATLRKGEKPTVPMPEMKFQNRRIRVEMGEQKSVAPVKTPAQKV